MSPRKLSDESSATGKGMRSKVWLWPRKKDSARNEKSKRLGRTSARSRAHSDHEQARERGFDTYKWINVKNILLPKSDDELDERIVAAIAESILLFGLLHPIAVRSITEEQEDGETAEKGVLVAGAHRLEAMKRIGRKKIPCYYVQGDEIDAQLVRLGEDLWRKNLTVLRQAEKLVEYFNLASAKVNISGQLAQKSKLGRPPGGIALAARELPLLGRSVEARRKIINRAKKINQITPEAKQAAIAACLDNNQRALLKVAKAGGQRAQLKMVAELAEISKELNAPRTRAAKGSTTGAKVSAANAIKSPPLQPDAAQSAIDSIDTSEEEAGKCRTSQKTTTFDEMNALWKPEHSAKWSYLPYSDRERFIEKLRRARLKARADVVQFLSDVFRGRLKVKKQDLFSFAATRGFPKGTIRKALRGLGYKSKRQGRGFGAASFVINLDREPLRYLMAFSDAEIAAAGHNQPDPRDTTAAKNRTQTEMADYFDDI